MTAKKRYERIDYSRHHAARGKMTYYLKAGNFRKIAGAPVFSGSVHRRRAGLIIAALIIALIGLGGIFF
jgi:hypothetical protein